MNPTTTAPLRIHPAVYAILGIAAIVGILVATRPFGTSSAPQGNGGGPASAILAPNTNGQSTNDQTVLTPSAANPAMHHYIEIVQSCDWEYVGTCVNMRSGPGTDYSIVLRLRTGIVLEVEGATVPDAAGNQWYKVVQDSGLHFPERVTSDWYVIADPASVRAFDDPGEQDLNSSTPQTGKHIVVTVSTETLDAYNADGSLFMEAPVSTGLADTPTSDGTFTIFKKTPSRYMQGPIPGLSDQYYDLPGVPWDLYFTEGGAVIHGAYWHNEFGHPWSHGCVNLSLENAKVLYDWADVGTVVTVKN